MPATVGRFSHAMCALSCQRHARFGLEDGGLFCACMDYAEVAAATALHPYECALPCAGSGAASGNGRFHLTPTALPCGGNEAVADDGYKNMIVDSAAKDIVYSNLFTGVHGNNERISVDNVTQGVATLYQLLTEFAVRQ